ncbi:MAG: Na+/H+ antiporter subunit E [Gammaproteobacteria bacterium]
MRRIPPVFLVVLVIMWLLVNSTVSLGHIVLGTIVSALLLLAAAPLRPLQPTIRRGYRLFTLMAVVFVDIVRSNIGVARVILGLVGERDVRAGFVHIPLDMTDPHGLAGLSMIITATPGTIWVDLNLKEKRLTIHVLDLLDEDEWIHRIKERYERPLMEVFE